MGADSFIYCREPVLFSSYRILLMVKIGEKMKYKKCTRCGQHNENITDDTCFECREFEYQLNLGE